MGRKGQRQFRVVVAEKRSKRDGNPIDVLGWFEKTEKGIRKEIDVKKAKEWIANGAKASPTVAELIK